LFNKSEIELQNLFIVKKLQQTVEQVRSDQLKWFAWWPYEPTGIYVTANETVVLESDGDITATVGTIMSSGSAIYNTQLSVGKNQFKSPRAGALYLSNPKNDVTSVKLIKGGKNLYCLSPANTLHKIGKIC